MINTLISVLTNGHAEQLLPALLALALTFGAIWLLKGRFWAVIYVALIPFLNWSFGDDPGIPGDGAPDRTRCSRRASRSTR